MNADAQTVNPYERNKQMERLPRGQGEERLQPRLNATIKSRRTSPRARFGHGQGIQAKACAAATCHGPGGESANIQRADSEGKSGSYAA